MAQKKRSDFLKRLVITLIGVPTVIVFLFFPQNNHIFINIIMAILIPILGSYELNTTLFKSDKKLFLPIVNFTIFLFSFLYAHNILNIQSYKLTLPLFVFYIIIIFSYILASSIFHNEFEKSFKDMLYKFLGIIYIGVPSFFLPFIFNVSLSPKKPNPIFFNIDSSGTMEGSLLAIFFIVIVWSNDIFAYVWGMTLGRKNLINMPASPNKSWAGFIGAYITTFLFVPIYYFMFNNIFKFEMLPIWLYFLFPVLTGILVPIGDLVESVFKRHSNEKDSGTIILGRGGILDSVDTILYVFPIYFMILQIYFAAISK